MAEITQVRVDVSLNATISVNGEAWVKPGCSAGASWNGVPEDGELRLVVEHLSQTLIEPTVEELTSMLTQQLRPLSS